MLEQPKPEHTLIYDLESAVSYARVKCSCGQASDMWPRNKQGTIA